MAGVSPEVRPSRSPRVTLWVAGLLLLFAGLATRAAWVKSETYDEPMYILSAYSYVETGDLSFNREHPPFAKYLMGLPLLLLDLELPEGYQSRPGIQFAFYAHQASGVHPHTILFLARLPGVLLGVLLGLYVFRWARLAFGALAGVTALALYALNPNILAHAVVASNDFALTVFCFATLYHLWRWLSVGARASLGWCAITLGLAIGSKLTALMLLPVMGLIVLVCSIRRRRLALVGQALLAGFVALGVLWLLYLGEARSLEQAHKHPRFTLRGNQTEIFRLPWLEPALESVFGRQTPIPLLSFVKGIDMQLDHADEGHHNYYRGEVHLKSVPQFYVVSWLIKNPEGLTLLLLLGLLALKRTRRGAVHEACLYGFPALTLLVFSTSNVQLGFKYILVVVPFACVAAARLFATDAAGKPGRAPTSEARAGAVLVAAMALFMWSWTGDLGAPSWSHWVPLILAAFYFVWAWWAPPVKVSGTRTLLAPLIMLVVWSSGAALARQPHNLMYFNEWVGGPENGHRWSVIGDDWGQDTVGLGLWMAEQGLDHIYYDYYGEGDPERWGVRYTPTFGAQRTFTPIEGLVAVHVTLRERLPENYEWLAGREPVAVIGHTIFVYNLSAEDRVDALFQQVGQPLNPKR
jgi:4-amino-4-deoxy-L-arabinose transferase-like glycosyltransferase